MKPACDPALVKVSEPEWSGPLGGSDIGRRFFGLDFPFPSCRRISLFVITISAALNGMETVKSIRQLLRSEVPAIVVTGDTRAKIMDRMTASGVAVLTKPFRSQDLFAMMARLHGTETLRADACGPGVYVQCTT